MKKSTTKKAMFSARVTEDTLKKINSLGYTHSEFMDIIADTFLNENKESYFLLDLYNTQKRLIIKDLMKSEEELTRNKEKLDDLNTKIESLKKKREI